MKNFAVCMPWHFGLASRRSLCAWVAAVWLSVFSVCAEELPVFGQILQNILQQELAAVNVTSVDANTRNYLSTLRDDGSFPDIAYTSTSLTNWEPPVHLNRMRYMILSYVDTRSTYYASEALHTAIVNMLNYWHTANPSSTNWYNWEIGWPQRMGLNLSLMRAGKEKVPAELEAKILERIQSLSKGPNRYTGANQMDVALQWIYRTTLQGDKANLDFAVSQFYQPLTFNTGEGLQSDYSYLQHGPQLYIGGYGQSALTAFFKVVFYLLDTEYAGGEWQAYVNNFLLQTYMPVIRGQYILYGAVGRGMVRKGGIARASFASSLQKMIQLDPEHSAEYEKGILRLNATEDADYGLEPYHRHYWRGDYTLHQRPGYTMDVRLASTRTYRCENGNGENLKGYFLTEGGTEIVQRGDEYLDIFPVWDWSHIPGTTTPVLSSVPQPKQWGQYGQSTFAGGVSDGTYGLTAYRMVNNDYDIHISGNKSWFFFDREVVCLGSDIRSTNASNVIHTTVNQSLLKGDVTVAVSDESAPVTLEKGTHGYDRIAWLNQDSISYYFPDGGKIGIRNDAQSGTWNSVATTNQDDALQTKDVFKAWLDHGVQPTKGCYTYYIVPNTPTIADGRAALDDLLTVNTDTLQAVYNRSLHRVGAVFYRKGTLKIGDVEVSATAPCAVMFSDVDTEHVGTYVADPSFQLDTLTLYAKFPMLTYKTMGCRFDRTTHYAGSTHTYEINAQSADSVYIPVRQLTLDTEEVLLDYRTPRATLTARFLPENASVQPFAWHSSDDRVVAVDAEGHLYAMGSGEAVVTVSSVDGVEASCRVTVAAGLRTSLPLADTYVYDGAPGTNYGTAEKVVVRTDGSGYNRAAYFLFPLDGLEGVDPDKDNVKVKVALYTTYGAENATEVYWRFYPVDDVQWEESVLTWNKRPTAGTSILGRLPCRTPLAYYNEYAFVELNLTNYALTKYREGQRALSLYIDQTKRATNGKGTTEFASKEHPDFLKRPRILVQADGYSNALNPAVADEAVSVDFEHDQLNVQVRQEVRMELCNMQGMVLQAVRLTPGEHHIQVGTLPDGLYVARIGGRVFRFGR